MATGYEDSRFETKVDENLYCVICRAVMKDPMQCSSNEHHFCRKCIVEHLKNTPKCPTCQDHLTVQTLANPQRFLVQVLGDLEISCENSGHGCTEIVKLASLKTHEANCEFSPKSCSNGGCFKEDEILKELQGRQINIVVAGNIGGRSVEAFNMATRTWRPLPQMNENRYGASSVLFQDQMIVTGGPGITISTEQLHLAEENGHWVESQFRLPFQELYGHVCLIHQNGLLVIGGRSNNDGVDTIHQLTPPFGSELLINMQRQISYHGAVKIGGNIFIIGGIDELATRNNVLLFDPTAKTYRELNPLPYPVSQMATVVWRDNVVVLGGLDHEGNVRNTVILYNTTIEIFSMLPEMTTRRAYCTAVTIGDNIIVMGGLDERGNTLNTVECYNFGTNIWAEFPAMTTERARATAVVRYG